MENLILILGDQLSLDISSLSNANPKSDAILMMEVHEETTYVPHHPQKIVFILSSMRHFAETLRGKGFSVHYIPLTSTLDNQSFDTVVKSQVQKLKPKRIKITHPGEYRVLEKIRSWQKTLPCSVDILEDDRFFCSIDEFSSWMVERKQPRMEMFYRVMRKKTGILMDKSKPVGGDWNYDQANRKKLPKNITLPEPVRFTNDEITLDVIKLVKERFENHFGDLDNFNWGVTRHQALSALGHFITHCLPNFGDYQDAMHWDEYFLFHSALSPYINNGLLSPHEICKAAETAYQEGHAPINAVEGFIRQILGWREYVRGVYWHMMPEYAKLNKLGSHNPLPKSYWTCQTDMRCLKHTLQQTRAIAHSHHIQRLMITGNYALLMDVEPEQICEWYLAVYLDAFDWVELPNTLGMVMHADGGIMGSKPYIASGNYINKMSNFCKDCRYNVKDKFSSDACPFNYLYWNFLIEHEKQLSHNPRLAFPYRQLHKMSGDDKAKIQKLAKLHQMQETEKL